jgi:hypothetical protein
VAAKHTHEVVRPIPGMELRAGDLVDASGWRTAEKLERLRYLRPIVADVKALQEQLQAAHARIAQLEEENARLRGGKVAAAARR